MAIGRIPEPGTGIPESIIAAKGDILTGTANDTPAVLTVGTNGHTLVADSAETTGLKWAAPAVGGGGLVFINKTDFSASTATNINNVFTTTYDNYRIYVVANSDSAATITYGIQLRASGTNTTANYQTQAITGENTTVGANKNTLGTDEFFAGYLGASGFPDSMAVLDMSSPFIATDTSILGSSILARSGDPYFNIIGGQQTDDTSFDGFSIRFDNASTGSVYIYGYAKA